MCLNPRPTVTLQCVTTQNQCSKSNVEPPYICFDDLTLSFLNPYKYCLGCFECHCERGFVAVPGGTCVDYDECGPLPTDVSLRDKVYYSHCQPDSYCFNTKGSYLCICNDGFMGNGMDVNGGCSDIDEWFVSKFFSENLSTTKNLKYIETYKSLDKNHACVINSDCTNNDGSYECSCKIGYKGDPRKRCLDINECQG